LRSGASRSARSGLAVSTTDGGQISLADYRGKVVLLEFWATWCSVCVADLPAIKQLHEKYSAADFAIIGISMDEDRAALKKKVAEQALGWAQVMDGKSFDGDLAQRFDVHGTPVCYLLDRAGRIALRTSDSKKLEPAIADLIAKPLPPSQGARRDVWQRPGYVMDELGVTVGSSVADLGAGDGYFTWHLADRVGSTGRVYAVDISAESLDSIETRIAGRNYKQVVTVLGLKNDPRLPEASLDAILVVNAYHEMTEFDAMLRAMHRALRPGGRLAIIEADAESGLQRAHYQKEHKLPEAIVLEDATRHGFRLLKKGDDFIHGDPKQTWYFVIFQK
jgi:predicted methyltransferase